MRHRRRKNLKPLIIAFATMAVMAPVAQAGRVVNVDGGAIPTGSSISSPSSSYYNQSARAARSALNQISTAQQVAATRPDNRAGIRGIESTQTQAQSAVSRPDDRTGVRGPGFVEIQTPQVVTVKSDGFDWRDAGIGAGTVLGTTLVLISGLVLTRRRQGQLAT